MLVLDVLGDVGDRAAVLPAEAEALDQAKAEEDEGGREADGLVRGNEADHRRRQSHAGQRDDERVLPADLVAEPAEDEGAQGSDEEADREDGHGAEEGRHRMPLLEELDREDRGEAAEDVEVVPLDDVADGCGDDDAAQFAERDFGSPHWLPLQSRIAAVMGQPPQLWWWCTPAKSRDVGPCYTGVFPGRQIFNFSRFGRFGATGAGRGSGRPGGAAGGQPVVG